MLEMTDEAGEDHKILAVPVHKLTKLYDDVQSPQDLHDDTLDQITHFFEQYKALESGKWVKVENWVGVERAHEEILSSIARYNRVSA
jgi:inorganic pyrophosphatase